MFDIVDTAGQEEYLYVRNILFLIVYWLFSCFSHVSNAYLQSCQGFLFVFALNQSDTVNDVKRLYNTVDETRNMKNIPKILVGNKSDLKDRDVYRELGEELANQWNCKYIETSAKDGTNINEAFYIVAREIIDYNIKQIQLQNRKRKKGFCILL